MIYIFTILLILMPLGVTSFGQVASGGGYEINQAVIANGGGSSSGGAFHATGTSGQSAAGGKPSGYGHSAQNGFWTGVPLAPTAAEVTVEGRVVTANGRGIRNVFLRMDYPDGTNRTARTSTFGYFQFYGIPAGQTVVISVFAKRYTFLDSPIVLNVMDSVSDIRFVAHEGGD